MPQQLLSLMTAAIVGAAPSIHARPSRSSQVDADGSHCCVEDPHPRSTAAQRLKVSRVRLETAPPLDQSPSALLKFDLTNDGSSRIANFVFRIAIIEVAEEPSAVSFHVLAGPFRLRGKTALEPANVMSFEMRLRNLSADCDCRPVVEILSADEEP